MMHITEDRLVKGIVFGFMTGVVLFLAVFAVPKPTYGPVIAEGVAVGDVLTVERMGVAWKTWDVQIRLGHPAHGAESYTVRWSIHPDRPELVDQAKALQDSGTVARFEWQRHYWTPAHRANHMVLMTAAAPAGGGAP